jgi:cell division protein FtsA
MLGHVAGLDIGSSEVRCLIADVYRDGRTQLVGTGQAPCRGLKKGVVVEMDETVRAIREATSDAEQKCDRQVEDVVAGITGEHITMHTGEGRLALTPPAREISSDDVRRVVENSRLIAIAPDQEILDVIPRVFRVDGREGGRQPEGIFGSRLEVTSHVIVGLTSCVQNLLRAVSRAGVEAPEIVPEIAAAGMSVLDDGEREVGVALVDIGGGTCNAAVFRDGILQALTTLPVGGQHVTSDISKLLRTSLEEAERLKVEHGTVSFEDVPEDETVAVRQLGQPAPRMLRRRMLAQIIQARVWEMLVLSRSRLERDGQLSLLPGGLVMTGAGAKIDGIAKLASEVFRGTPVRIGQPSGIDGLDGVVGGPEWATGVGLIRYAAEVMRQEALGEQRTDWFRSIRRKLFARDR